MNYCIKKGHFRSFHLILSIVGTLVLSSLGPIHISYAAAPSVVTNVVPVPASGQVTLTWTNPASVDFTGTMVRYSTTAFPTSTSDGTLVSDVAGAVSGTSTVTQTGLTNGTIYYFSLFSHNAVPEYSAAVNTQQLVMAASFSDDFESLSTGSISGQNGWSAVAGTWTVLDTSGEQTLKSSTENLTYDQYRVLNGGSVNAYSNQMVRADWRGTTTNAPGQLFLRAQSASADAGGYALTTSGGVLKISYKSTTGTAFTSLGTGAFTPVANTWYVYEFSVVNNAAGLPVLSAYVWARGSAKPSTPTVTATDTANRFAQGVFSVGKSATTAAEYDNVFFYTMMGDSSAKVIPGDGANTLTWTNPVVASYAGTMVRVSTSAYPTTPTDGTLVATVTGSSGGSSSTTHSGLTNGTLYYYTLFPYDNSGLYGTPLSMSQVAYAEVLSDSFNASTVDTLAGQNGWGIEGGTWTVADVSSERVLSASTSQTYLTNMAVNGQLTNVNQVVSYRFKSDAATNGAGYVWLRRQTNNDGYLIWHSGNSWTISTQVGATFTNRAAAATTTISPLEANVWFNVEASVITNGSGHPVINVFSWKEGKEKPLTPTITYTDSSDLFTSGYFALGRNISTASCLFDDVHYAASLSTSVASPNLTITAPAAAVGGEPDTATLAITDEAGTFYIPYIQTSTTLNVAATLDSVPAGGGIRFILNSGLPSQQTVNDLTGPTYTASFTGLARAEYTLDAYEILGDGVSLSGDPLMHDHRDHIGIGEIFALVGDSTTDGSGGTAPENVITSWLDADAGSLSADHRNFPQDGSGLYKESYLTDLNDKLSAYFGYPIFLMNEGSIGIRASNYESTVILSNWTFREQALAPTRWLVSLGNGDSQAFHSAATYRADMETFLSRLTTTYGASLSSIYVPYPFYDSRDPEVTYLTSYLPEILDMRSDLGLAGGADLFNTFINYKPAQYYGVHPNATGYEHIARLWAMAIMKPTVSSSVSGRQVTLNWNDLSAFESTVAGYRISYGTSAGNLDQTMTVGDVTTATLTGLSWGTTYYYAVTGFDADPYYVSYTDQSDTGSAVVGAGTSVATVSAVSGDTTESGGTATFTVVLSSQPDSTVTIPVSSSDTTEGTVSPSSLTFTTGNWSTPQTVTVTGVNDAVDDADVAYSIVLGAMTSSDITYSGVNPTDVSLSNRDDDGVGVTLSSTFGDTAETGGATSFTVVLSSQPLDSVVIAISSSDTSEGSVSPNSLTFTTGNWNTPQTVTVTGVDDPEDDGDVSYSVVLASATSADTAYNGLEVGDYTARNIDNDAGSGSGTAATSGNTHSSSQAGEAETGGDSAGGTGDSGVSGSGDFVDVTGGFRAEQIQALAADGIVQGNPDGSFGPGKTLNRAETATMLGRLLEIDPDATPREIFSDVSMGAWYGPYVAGLKDLGLLHGNPEGAYLPGEEINRAAFFKLTMQVFLYLHPEMQNRYDTILEDTTGFDYVDLPADAWYRDTAVAAMEFGFADKSGCGTGICFVPEATLTRGEASTILYEMFYEEHSSR